MPFKKGIVTNPDGRPKGAKGVKTLQWEKFSEFCMNGGLKKFERELNKLSGRDYIIAFLQLLEFHKPKLARSIITDEDVEQMKSIIFASYDDTKRLNGSGGNRNLHTKQEKQSGNSS